MDPRSRAHCVELLQSLGHLQSSCPSGEDFEPRGRYFARPWRRSSYSSTVSFGSPLVPGAHRVWHCDGPVDDSTFHIPSILFAMLYACATRRATVVVFTPSPARLAAGLFVSTECKVWVRGLGDSLVASVGGAGPDDRLWRLSLSRRRGERRVVARRSQAVLVLI